MANGIAVDVGLARTISRQISTVRRFFEDAGFLEVFAPHLTRNRAIPFRDVFEVSAPGSDFVGALRVGAAYFLAETISELKRAYTISTSFRAQPTPGSKLAEFRLGEAWSEGGLADAHRLAEGLLREQLSALLGESTPVSVERGRQLESIEFPLRSVTYREAMERAGLDAGQRTTSAVARQIVQAFGSQPLFVTHLPENLDPGLTDVRQDGDRNQLGFVLLAPFAGNVMSGGELETDQGALSEQIRRSAFLQELVAKGGDGAQLEPYMGAISSLRSPHFKLAVGFERLTQFFLGAEQIEDAVLLPVHGEVVEGDGETEAAPIVIVVNRVVIVIEDPEPI